MSLCLEERPTGQDDCLPVTVLIGINGTIRLLGWEHAWFGTCELGKGGQGA